MDIIELEILSGQTLEIAFADPAGVGYNLKAVDNSKFTFSNLALAQIPREPTGKSSTPSLQVTLTDQAGVAHVYHLNYFPNGANIDFNVYDSAGTPKPGCHSSLLAGPVVFKLHVGAFADGVVIVGTVDL